MAAVGAGVKKIHDKCKGNPPEEPEEIPLTQLPPQRPPIRGVPTRPEQVEQRLSNLPPYVRATAQAVGIPAAIFPEVMAQVLSNVRGPQRLVEVLLRLRDHVATSPQPPQTAQEWKDAATASTQQMVAALQADGCRGGDPSHAYAAAVARAVAANP